MGLYFIEATVISGAAIAMFSGLIKPGTLGVFLGCMFLVLVSLTVNSTHSIVGSAAPMDIGGKKMAGFALGVIDSFQYYGSALSLFLFGKLFAKFGWSAWYPLMVMFALSGGWKFAYDQEDVTAGFGVKLNSFGVNSMLDYAYNNFKYLPGTHTVTFEVMF